MPCDITYHKVQHTLQKLQPDAPKLSNYKTQNKHLNCLTVVES